MLLLALSCIATVFGIVLIASATANMDTYRYVEIQAVSFLIGIALFIVFSLVDIDFFAGKWKLLLAFNVLFILPLFIFGSEGGTGNRSWIRFMSIGIQPAEVVKISFIILMAKQLDYNKERINSPVSIFQFAAHLGFMIALIMASSSDMGMSLVYIFIFIFMCYSAGIRFGWFGAGALAVATAMPVLWNHLNDRYKARILVVFDPSVDIDSLDIGWQTALSKLAIKNGGMFGQGLLNGDKTQAGEIYAQHNDFIFTVAGEELGLVGCICIIALLTAIIIRCIQIGLRSDENFNTLVCFGIAGMLIFQVLLNIGMCIGLVPVIGLTLPFFSYGGTSIITMFAAMGIVSGLKMRPSRSMTKYVRPPLD